MKKYFYALFCIFNSINNSENFLKSKKKNINKIINEISFNDVCSNQNVPKFNNSAMDGYAIISKNTKNIDKKKEFLILNTIAAGKYIEFNNIKENEIVEIMTGARVPSIFDSVIKKEDTIKINKNKIEIKKNIKKNENIRLMGSDFKINDNILEKGDIIKPEHLLMLSSIGIKEIKILKKPKIYLICTGDEIINEETNEKTNSSVYNSSKIYIINFFQKLGFNIIFLGTIKDNQKEFLQKIENLLNKKELIIIITTGAVSVGSFDFIPQALKSKNIKILFHGVKIKPGKPILFGKYKKFIYFFCLPGNPISSILGMRFFIYPFLRHILGLPLEKPIKAKLITKHDIIKKHDTFLKSYCYNKQSKFYAKILENQDSFRTKPMSQSNSFILLKINDKSELGCLANVYFYNPLNF